MFQVTQLIRGMTRNWLQVLGGGPNPAILNFGWMGWECSLLQAAPCQSSGASGASMPGFEPQFASNHLGDYRQVTQLPIPLFSHL